MANPNFPNNPGYNLYVGARYVPLFADPIEWDMSKTYEPLTIVSYQGNSYTSKTFVPANTQITDTTYWALTGNYNAQLGPMQENVSKLINLQNSLNNVVFYGADPSGVKDSYAAFTEALALNNAIFIPAGTYKLNSQLNLTSNACLIGEGASCVTLLGNGINAVGRDIELSGFTYDGQDAYPGLTLDGYGFRLVNMCVTRVKTDAITFNNTKDYYYAPKHGTTFIENVFLNVNRKNGVVFNKNCRDATIIHLNSRANGQDADNTYCSLVNYNNALKVESCHFWNEPVNVLPNVEKYQILNTGALYLSNCHIEGGKTAILALFGNNSFISNTRFYSPDGDHLIELSSFQNTFNSCLFSPDDDCKCVVKAVKYNDSSWVQYNSFINCLSGSGGVVFIDFTNASSNGLNYFDLAGPQTLNKGNLHPSDRYRMRCYPNDSNKTIHFNPLDTSVINNPVNGDSYVDSSGYHIYVNGSWKTINFS